nr:hypothetical protein [Chryseobacterium indologenes]
MSRENFRKSEDLFAIRQFLKEIPDIKDLILLKILKRLSGKSLVKNILL